MPKKKIPKLIKVAIYLIVIYMICWGILMALIFSGNFPPNVYERSEVDSLSFSPDGLKLMSITHEDTAQIWDINSGDELSSHDVGNHGVALWFPDGKTIGINHYSIHPTNNGLAIYNITNFNKIGMINRDFAQIYTLNDFGIISTNFIKYYKDLKTAQYNISLWNSTTLTEVKQINISIMNPLLGLSPVGGKIACLPWKGDVLRIIDISNESYNLSLENMDYSVKKIMPYDLLSFRWSQDGERIGLLTFFNSNRNHVYHYLWDSTNGSRLLNKTFTIQGSIADISPDLSKFIYADPRETNVSIIDILLGEPTITLEFSEWISTVKWSPDGNRIAAGSNDGIIKVWDATTGELIQTMMTPKDHRVPT